MDRRTWLQKKPNYLQPPEERRAKYALCLMLGDTTPQAHRRRDWYWPKIARVHGWPDDKEMFKELGLERQSFIAFHRNGQSLVEREKCLTSA